MEASTLKTMRATAKRLKARRDAGDELVLTGMEAHWIGVTELLVIEEVERLQGERDQAIAEAAALRASVEALAEELRDDLWVGDDDHRGHAYYERLVDLVHASNGEE